MDSAIILLRRLGRAFEQAQHDVLDRDALSVGVEVGEDAMAEHRRDHRRHVVARDIQPAVENRTGRAFPAALRVRQPGPLLLMRQKRLEPRLLEVTVSGQGIGEAVSLHHNK